MKASWLFKNTDSIDAIVDINGWINGDKRVTDILEKHRNIKVTIENAPSTRTIAANNYYWGVLIPAYTREWPDFSKIDIHNTLGERFRLHRKPQEVIEKEILMDTHRSEWMMQSTTDMNTFDFWMYCEQCTQALFEIGGYLDEYEHKAFDDAKKLFKKRKDVNEETE